MNLSWLLSSYLLQVALLQAHAFATSCTLALRSGRVCQHVRFAIHCTVKTRTSARLYATLCNRQILMGCHAAILKRTDARACATANAKFSQVAKRGRLADAPQTPMQPSGSHRSPRVPSPMFPKMEIAQSRRIRLRQPKASDMMLFRVQRYERAWVRVIRRRGCFMDCVAGRPNGLRNGEIPPVSTSALCCRALRCNVAAPSIRLPFSFNPTSVPPAGKSPHYRKCRTHSGKRLCVWSTSD